MRNWKEVNFNELKSNVGLQKEFYRDYAKRFGKPCPTCKNKLFSYYNNLIKYKEMDTKKTCKLKANCNPYDRANHRILTDATMDDETAIRLLEENENRAGWFEVLPEGYKPGQKSAKASSNEPKTFEEELIDLPKIGKATAKKIIDQVTDKDGLKAALEAGELELKEEIIAILTEYAG